MRHCGSASFGDQGWPIPLFCPHAGDPRRARRPFRRGPRVRWPAAEARRGGGPPGGGSVATGGASAAGLQRAMTAGTLTSAGITAFYLERITG